MDPFAAVSLLKLFFEIVDKGPGAIVPELLSMAIPGSDILTAAELLGVDLTSNPTIRKDPSLQRYLNISLDRTVIKGGLDRSINKELDR